MREAELKKVKELVHKFPQIKLGYFFGSRASGTSGPMSDYDFAFYIEEKDQKKIIDIQSMLISNISLILKTDAVDVSVLNLIKNPDLAYNIISTGILFYDVEPYRIMAEPKIMNLYFDFKKEREKNTLTRTKNE